MIIDLRHDHAAFRQALREWLPTAFEPDWADRARRGGEHALVETERNWLATLSTQGLGIPHWPSQYGGADLDLAGQIILTDELIRARAPRLGFLTVSLNHIPGTLIPCGTDEQKRKYLPEVAKGTIWCQGFSEPSAGSDLASLRTRAVRDGDHYVVNGQKIWSSMAQHARHCILLVRTDPNSSKHAGITFLLMDMDTPGLEARPIRQITGQAEFCELFLTDVRIPVENRVGEENAGWAVTQQTLASERGVLWFDYAERRRIRVLDFLKDAMASRADWLDDHELRRQFMALFAEIQAGRRMIRELLRDNAGGHGAPALTSAFVKLHDTALNLKLGDLVTRMRGIDALSVNDTLVYDGTPDLGDFMWGFGSTISGGTNEIMRNIISERGLGMPKG